MKKLLITALLFLVSSSVQAIEIPEIKKMMKELGKNMQIAQMAILMEDEETLSEVAKKIYDHPKAGMATKIRIMGVLKLEMGDFKAWDDQVHKYGKKLYEAAQAGDKPAQAKAYVKVVDGCLGCHVNFRYRLKDPK